MRTKVLAAVGEDGEEGKVERECRCGEWRGGSRERFQRSEVWKEDVEGRAFVDNLVDDLPILWNAGIRLHNVIKAQLANEYTQSRVVADCPEEQTGLVEKVEFDVDVEVSADIWE